MRPRDGNISAVFPPLFRTENNEGKIENIWDNWHGDGSIWDVSAERRFRLLSHLGPIAPTVISPLSERLKYASVFIWIES